MTSLLQQAILLKEKKDAKADRKNKKGKTSLSQEILNRLKRDLKNMPIILELISTYYNVNIDFTVDEVVDIVLKMRESDPRFYEINIGDESTSLIQEKHMASRDRGCTTEPMYQAWAVKFAGIYGLDIYFIPYTNPKRGFAITVFDLKVKDEDESKTFFVHDMYKKFAVNQIAKGI